jgi:hypothetical protein
MQNFQKKKIIFKAQLLELGTSRERGNINISRKRLFNRQLAEKQQNALHTCIRIKNMLYCMHINLNKV